MHYAPYLGIVSLALAGAVPLAAEARTFNFDIDIGDTVDVDVDTSAVREGERFSFGTSAQRSNNPVDIMFLSDTTGSMGRLTDAASREADEIVSRTSSFGNVAWSVGSYRDFPTRPWGGQTDYPFRLDQSITDDATSAANGLRSWFSSGGFDFPESNLYALQEMATRPDTYRANSDRYLLWFGDAPAHDPFDTPGYPGPTLQRTISDLTTANITVLGVDLGGLNNDGELFQIVDRTGGSIGALDRRLSDIVYDSLFEAIDVRTDVTLDFSLIGAGGVSRFLFEDTFENLVRGTYRLTVDTDTLSSNLEPVELAFDPDPELAPIPLPATLPACLTGFLALLATGRASVRRDRRT